MPLTEQQIQEFESYLGQSVPLNPNDKVEQYSYDNDALVNAPRNTPSTLLQNESSFDMGTPSEQMFGHVRLGSESELMDRIGFGGGVGDVKELVRGGLSSLSNLTIGTLGRLSTQFAERIADDEGLGARLAEVPGDMDALIDFFTSGDVLQAAYSPVQTLGAGLRVAGVEDDVARNAHRFGQGMIEKNNRFIIESGLGLTENEEPTFMYQLGQGATSLVGALGLTVVTKSPTAAALAFGTIQQSEVYQDAREEGLDINDSTFYANIAGLSEGVLESIGLHVLFKSPGKGVLSKIVFGAATEATQEASQTGAEIAIKEFGDIDEFTSEEIIQALASSSIIGGILGGGAGGAIGSLQNEVVKSTNKAMETELAISDDARMEEPGLRVSRRMKEDEKISRDIIEAFMQGIDVSTVFETKEQKEAFIERASNQLRDAQITDTKTESAGVVRTLEALESEILGQLEELGVEGEQAFKKFAEEHKDKLNFIEPELSLSELNEIKDPNVTFEKLVEQERGYLDNLKKDIQENGLKKPIDIMVREDGSKVIWDGMHRLFVLNELGITDGIAVRYIDKNENEIDPSIDIQSEFEQTGAFRKIDKREQKLSDELQKTIAELEAASTLEGAEFRSAFGKAKFEITSKALQRIKNSKLIQGLRKGFKEGQKFSKAQTKAVQNEFIDIINSLPQSVDDKFKVKLLKRTRNITTLKQLNKQVQKLIDDTLAHLSRKAFTSVLKDVAQILKSTKSSKGKKMSASVQDMVNEMAGYNKKNATAKIQEMGGSLLNTADEMKLRYLELLQRPNVGRLPWQIFRNDLELMILEGKTSWQKQNKAREERLGKEEESITGGSKVIDESKNTGMTRFEKVMSPINYVVRTYQSIVDAAALQDTSFGKMSVADKAFRRAMADFNQTIRERTAEVISSKYIAEVLSNKKKTITIVTDNGNTEVFTMGEAIHRWMEFQNDETRQILETSNGYNESNMQDIENFIEQDGIKFANVMFEIYQESYDRVNEKYKEVHGVSLPSIESYVPRARTEFSADPKEVQLSGIQNIFEFFVPSSFKQRKNAKGRIMKKDVIDLAIQYANNTEWYIAYQDFYSDTNTLLGSEAVRQQIINRIGINNFINFQKHIDLMKTSSRDWNKSQVFAFDFVRKHFTTSILAANPQIGIKQLSSMFASMGEMPAHEWMIGATEFMSNPMKAWEEMSKHDSFRLRGNRSFDKELQLALMSEGSKAISEKLTLLDYMLKPVQYGDKVGAGISAYAHFSYLKRQGMNPEQALEKSMDNLERSQQSVLPSQLSLAQKEGSSVVRMFTMFTSSPIALVNMQMQALADLKNGKITKRQAFRKLSVYQFVIPGFFGWAASAFDDDPDKIYPSLLIGPYSAIPFYGNSMEWVAAGTIAALTDTKSTAFKDESFSPDIIAERVHDNFKIMRKLIEDEPVTLEETLEASLDFIELWNGLPANNVVDIMDGVDKVMDGDSDGWWKILGYSDYTIEQKDDKIKVRF